MRRFAPLVIAALAVAANAAAVVRKNEDVEALRDTIIVPGGPAGLSALSALARVPRKARAAAVVRETAAPTTDFDAIVVGGGPAGLSALSGLARVRRKVLLIDSGEYRNDPTRHMHDVIGFDGKGSPSTTLNHL